MCGRAGYVDVLWFIFISSCEFRKVLPEQVMTSASVATGFRCYFHPND